MNILKNRYVRCVLWQLAIGYGIAVLCSFVMAVSELRFEGFFRHSLGPYAEISTDRFLRISDKVGVVGYLYSHVKNLDIIIRIGLTLLIGCLSLKCPVRVAIIIESVISIISVSLYFVAAYCF